MVRIAIVGDVHRCFTAFDVAYFNQSHYDLILFVGDLANWWPHEALELAGEIAQLRKPVLLIPGNHDTVTAFQLLAEVKQISVLTNLFALGQSRRVRKLRQHLAGIVFCGYSTHPFEFGDYQFDVIAARPYSMGGPALACRSLLKKQFGLESMEASADRLKLCIDAAESDQIIFLAHNGPYGLGSAKDAIWGCDFKAEGGDFGDEDLQVAVEYARARGKRVIGVVAGHMHLRTAQGRQRPWLVEQNGISYVNAARVPRIHSNAGVTLHHHVSLAFDRESSAFEEVLIQATATPNIGHRSLQS